MSRNSAPFRSSFALDIFNQKYRHEGAEDWPTLARTLVEDVCGDLIDFGMRREIEEIIADMKFIPGGRYLYYAGRDIKAFNNCYLLRAEEDTREDWAMLSWKAESCLSTGGGIGIDYSVYRPRNAPLKRTGGVASGPTSKARMINEIGREVMQGGSRRSAIYGSLDATHPDAMDWIYAKDWGSMMVPGTGISLKKAKEADFNFPAPLDMTNMSLNYTDGFTQNEVWLANCFMACKTGEPGMSFNFGAKARETLRNACCEVVSEDDSDVCNIGSVNLSRISDIDDLARVCYLASVFLYCGTQKATLPYEKVSQTRAKNMRQGLGLMGVHEWLIAREQRYEVTPELHEWLAVWKENSEAGANWLADKLGRKRPVAYRAIAPTGTIGIMAGTTTGIEPLFAVAYQRRYLKNGTEWHYQYVVDSAAKELIEMYGADPEKIESALDLANDIERRIKFQADVQDYVDMAISSTINMPAWGTALNNEDTVRDFSDTLYKYAPRLRGFTVYPDGARGGQPLTSLPYSFVKDKVGVEYKEHDSCKGGVCGM